ncbi:MAG: hypothetical protein IKJ37_06375 [Kiritimatiellae bacterium]|nr:hypothetical protein [Kiritimatiellia bacterium]
MNFLHRRRNFRRRLAYILDGDEFAGRCRIPQGDCFCHMDVVDARRLGQSQKRLGR